MVKTNYVPHYYGPYSAEVSILLEELVSLGLLDEKKTLFVPSNYQRYDYVLSDDGKSVIETLEADNEGEYKELERIVNITKEKTDFDVNTIACAAKIKYLLGKQKRPMTKRDMVNKANNCGWKLNNDQLDGAISLLKELKLAR